MLKIKSPKTNNPWAKLKAGDFLLVRHKPDDDDALWESHICYVIQKPDCKHLDMTSLSRPGYYWTGVDQYPSNMSCTGIQEILLTGTVLEITQ